MPESFIKSFSHLKNLKNPENALHMLKRIASLVKPIMKKHDWVLPCLAEFYPDEQNLLDVGGGEKILLRLRPPHDADRFLELDEVVQTMLHELTHNVHGPHDDKFYKYLSGLQDEYDALISSGYSGEGFYGKGQRVGVNVSHNLPPHLARAKALEAAERRKLQDQVMGGGGRRLGGGSQSNQNLSPRELAARAADRRARDDKACGQGDIAKQEAEKASKNSVQNDVIDLTLSDSDDEVQITVAKPSTASKRPGSGHPTGGGGSSQKKSRVVVPNIKPSSQTGWDCPACTLENRASASQCDACLSPRPVKQTTAGWTCSVCTESGISNDFWSCTFCGTIKASS
ncbi:WLM-domain-containing protein [Marasmius fiardii PR-910]|nr:WLM-domain-containing protein [Marasmius fiardii PR-910]